MTKQIALKTFGCKANQADSVFLRGLFQQGEYEIVENLALADYVVLNTCTVTDQADREARQFIRRAKRVNPAARVIVTGCYAQTQPESLRKMPEVDAVIGNAEKDNFGQLLPTVGAGFNPAPTKILRQVQVPSFGFSHLSKNTRAQVKIQDGCNKFCSFCIIPYARGKNRSVPEDEILAELHLLREHGFEEAVLTGIHIGTYGLDRGTNLVQLLERIQREKPLARIRLSSLDPEEISDRLIQLVMQSDVICPHFHIAVQSGDDRILRRMKRRYESARFYQVIAQLMRYSSDVAIGTDIIVGFPGETRECFERTYAMLDELPISYAHIFPYSKRKQTAAATFPDQTDIDVKRDRGRQLRELMQHKKRRYYQQFIGQEVEIIVESDRDLKTGKLRGMTRHYMPTLIDGPDALMRQRVDVSVLALEGQKAYGKVLQL